MALAPTVNDTTSPQGTAEPKLTLKPAGIDLLSPKIQLVLAAIAALSICLYTWAPALNIGFLLDDYLHVDYISRALHGDWHDFLHNFYGNWANSPVMKSYRPLVSVSLFLDFLIWGANAFGFHLVNLGLLWGCSLLTGLIALELSGLRGNRLGASAAIWSTLLFAIYPLHLEAAAWIIGRVDLLCTLFYLLSVFAYLRFRLIKEKMFFHLSLISFVVAMLSKEMAVTLPAVITAAELLLYPFWEEKPAPEFVSSIQLRRMTGVLSFWFLLAPFILLRIAIFHGQMIGGYGESGLKALNNFGNRDTIDRIMYPVNLDLLRRTGAWDQKESLVKVLKAAYCGIAGSLIARLIMQAANWRILSFLLIWMIVSILPTFQIWQISPNLVGSRLFFLGSAPFVILLSFMALPAIDTIKSGAAKVFSCIGAASLLVVLTIWSFWLNFDLGSWRGAASSLKAFQSQLTGDLKRVPAGKSLVLLNMPGDYSGAGILTRGDYLKFLLRSPFQASDLSSRVRVLEPPDGATDFDYCASLKRLLNDKTATGYVQWNDEQRKLVAIKFTDKKENSAESNLQSFDILSKECRFRTLSDEDESKFDQVSLDNLSPLPLDRGKEWTIQQNGGRSFLVTGSGLRIKPGSEGLLILFPASLNPLDVSRFSMFCRTISGSQNLSFVWQAQNNEASAGASTIKQIPLALPFTPARQRYSVDLAHDRAWALTPSVKMIGLHLPKGNYEIEVSKLEFN